MYIPIRPVPTRLLTCSLAAAGCEKLAAISTQFEFSPNDLIFRIGEGPAAMWMVTHGKVFTSVPGYETFVESCGRRIFGLTETIAEIPYRETLLSDSYCTCTRVEREALLELLFEEHDACSALLRGLSRNYLRSVRTLAS